MGCCLCCVGYVLRIVVKDVDFDNMLYDVNFDGKS